MDSTEYQILDEVILLMIVIHIHGVFRIVIYAGILCSLLLAEQKYKHIYIYLKLKIMCWLIFPFTILPSQRFTHLIITRRPPL